ncbi:unnamed protein product [Bursaphelenchus xylophilus]|uniref:Metalloendopeptidase n=2 Tax=Bursaphelenchus xylophilus TaxID=6326 RepID=A0A7I8WLP0_BURXY|nr:unnamed protein product [Bursaphelenchus xylophilus]CAG9105356.1 unnamed protein product [Bursaphelenchus xylophilus]
MHFISISLVAFVAWASHGTLVSASPPGPNHYEDYIPPDFNQGRFERHGGFSNVPSPPHLPCPPKVQSQSWGNSWSTSWSSSSDGCNNQSPVPPPPAPLPRPHSTYSHPPPPPPEPEPEPRFYRPPQYSRPLPSIPDPLPEPQPEPIPRRRFDLGKIRREEIEGLWTEFSPASRNFLAPDSVRSGIPPHCVKRIVRYCSRNPESLRCRGHSEWISDDIVPDPPSHGSVFIEDENEIFSLYNFTASSPPRLPRDDVLTNVPSDLRAEVSDGSVYNLKPEERSQINAACSYGAGCLHQPKSALFDRSDIAEHHSTVLRFLNSGVGKEIDKNVETQFLRTYELKKAIMSKLGLDGKVEPLNDGIFQGDILLSTEQADILLNAVQNDLPPIISVPYSQQSSPSYHPYSHPRSGYGYNRGKRSGIFFEEQFIRQWSNSYIPYFVDPQMSADQEAVIDSAVEAIQAVSCLNFVKQSSRPTGNFIFYSIYPSTAFCGISNIGMQKSGNNVVYMSFMCNSQDNRGVAIHETLHALGVAHEHVRTDRDDHIRINWNNVDPNNYAFFALNDAKMFTSYGVPYGYDSIMHYKSTAATTATASGPSMTPLHGSEYEMGQRRHLSETDIQLLNKMYCKPESCSDRNVYCGLWANRGKCETSGWMRQNCEKSCDLC